MTGAPALAVELPATDASAMGAHREPEPAKAQAPAATASQGILALSPPGRPSSPGERRNEVVPPAAPYVAGRLIPEDSNLGAAASPAGAPEERAGDEDWERVSSSPAPSISDAPEELEETEEEDQEDVPVEPLIGADIPVAPTLDEEPIEVVPPEELGSIEQYVEPDEEDLQTGKYFGPPLEAGRNAPAKQTSGGGRKSNRPGLNKEQRAESRPSRPPAGAFPLPPGSKNQKKR